jgi:hypothetical protein
VPFISIGNPADSGKNSALNFGIRDKTILKPNEEGNWRVGGQEDPAILAFLSAQMRSDEEKAMRAASQQG